MTCMDGAAKELGLGGAAAQRQSHLTVQSSAVVQNPGSIGKALEDLREKKVSGDRAGYEDMLENLLLKLRLEYRKSE